MTPESQQHDQRIWPSTQAKPGLRDRIAASIASFLKRARSAAANFAAPPGVVTTPEGILYRPLARTTLDRALAPAGPGHLDYAVTIPDATDRQSKRIRIRVTRDRLFADLIAEPPLRPFQWIIDAATPHIRPGDRVIVIGAGTGHITAQLADHVGPSGSVTALEADALSVAYARTRYPLPNAAHERSTDTKLLSEPVNAAETIILTPLARDPDAVDLFSKVAKPGRIIAAGPHAPLLAALAALPDADVSELAASPRPDTDTRLAIARKAPSRVASGS